MKIFCSKTIFPAVILTIALLVRLDICLAGEDAFSFAEQGGKALEEKNYNYAIGYFSKAIELCTNYDYAYSGRGQAYHKKSQFENAIIDYTEAIRFDPSNRVSCYVYSLRGSVYYEINEFENAIKDYSKAIEINSNFSICSNLFGDYVNRGFAYNSLGQFDFGRKDFETVIKLGFTNAWAYLGRGVSKSGAGQYAKAIPDYDMAIQLMPSYEQAYWSRAIAHVENEDYSKAIVDFDKIIELSPTNATAIANRGCLFGKLGRFDKGISECKKALDLDSNSAEANNNLAWLLSIAPDSKFRDGQKAVEYAKKACDLTGWKHPFHLGTLAAAYAETGNFDEAIKWQKKGIEIGLSEKDLKEAQKYLELYKQNKPYHAESVQAK